MKKILLVGNYNDGNFGDDMLLIALKKGLSKIYPNYKYLVMAPREPRDFPLPPAGIRSFLKLNFVKARRAFRDSDLVILGGGGLLNPEEPRSIYIWGKVIRYACRAKKPIVMLAQSFAEKRRASIESLLNKVDLITVRDKLSLISVNKYAPSCPVREAADLAFLLDRNYFKSTVTKFEHDKFIVLNLRDYAYVDRSHLLHIAQNIVDYLLKYTNFAVYLLPFHADDLKLLRDFKELYNDNGRVFVLPHDKRECYAAIEQSSGVVSQRLHPLIAGMICDKPLFALSYSTKVASLCSSVLTSEFIVDLQKNESSINQHVLTSFVEACKGGVANYDKSDVDNMKNKSQINLKLIQSMLG